MSSSLGTVLLRAPAGGCHAQTGTKVSVCSLTAEDGTIVEGAVVNLEKTFEKLPPAFSSTRTVYSSQRRRRLMPSARSCGTTD